MDSIKKFFSTIWKTWKAFGQLIGDFIGRIFLMIFYLTITLPFGLGVRLFGDPLDIKNRSKAPAWLDRKTPEATIEVAHQQF